MFKYFKMFANTGKQTKYFIFFTAIYMLALVWTTAQAYARLYYSRSDVQEQPIVIQAPDQP